MWPAPWHLLHLGREIGRLAAGESALVTGAGGGLPPRPVQLARLAGAYVIAQTTSLDKADRIRALGAHEVIVHGRGEDFSGAVKKATGGQGVDVAIDNVGSQLFDPIRRSMGISGRWIMIGQLTGQFVPFNPAQLFLKNVSMLSATSTTRKQLEDCLALVARGAVDPIISLALPSSAPPRHMPWSRLARLPAGSCCVPTGDDMKIDAAIVGIGAAHLAATLPTASSALPRWRSRTRSPMPDCNAATLTGSRFISAGRSGPTTTASPKHSGSISDMSTSRGCTGFRHGCLQHAALAVSAGLADVVACVTAVSFTRERGFLGGPGDVEGNREEGGALARRRPMG